MPDGYYPSDAEIMAAMDEAHAELKQLCNVTLIQGRLRKNIWEDYGAELEHLDDLHLLQHLRVGRFAI